MPDDPRTDEPEDEAGMPASLVDQPGNLPGSQAPPSGDAVPDDLEGDADA